MAVVTITYAVGTYPQDGLLKLAKQIEKLAHAISPGMQGSGASTVLTITSTDSPGVASVALTAGPAFEDRPSVVGKLYI